MAKNKKTEGLSAEDALEQVAKILVKAGIELPDAEDAGEEEEESPKGKKSKKSDDDAEEVEFPSSDEVDDLEKDDVNKYAKQINLDVEDKKLKEIKALLKTAALIAEEEEVDEDDVDALCDALGIKAPKKLAAKVAAVAEYLGVSEAEEEEDEKPAKKGKKADADDDDDDEDEKPSKKKGKKAEPEEEEAEEVDAEKIAADADVPKKKVMLARLEAFNEAADKKAKIKFDEDDDDEIEAAYRKLIERLVDDNGDIAEWSEPYSKNEEGYCSGLPLEDAEVEGEKRDCGKCQVTGKTFAVDDEGDFEEIEEEEEEEKPAKKGKKAAKDEDDD